MTEPIKPATDEEVAWTKERAVVVTGIGSARAQKLVARIEADAATIEADRATIAELLAALESAEAFIARTSGGGETDFRAGLRAAILRARGGKPEDATDAR